MKISVIVAIDKNRLIGIDNKIPWDLPADRKHFKELTLHKPILMGRRTYESIGHPLPDRDNIVITRCDNLSIPGCRVFTSIEQALQSVANAPEIMIIGGVHIYEMFLPLVSKMYLTIVDHEFIGNRYFPKWNTDEWRETETTEHEPDSENIYKYTFVTLEKY